MRGKGWLVALLAVVALVVLWVWWGQSRPVVAVETVTVSRGVVEEIVTNTRAGTVKARLRSKLSPQTGGLVVALPHREGEWVEAGALVLKLDDQVQRAQWELA
ncbi:MAG: hypothetical protein NZ869_04515 [Thermoanaerobaculum sp.]|nr:hypothetical protein [Thermoanaerobaculum sp.]MDW7967899.1 hypothetical protein [Thermoanaerobaculum sp.]